jgi:hypothetical protein
MGNGDVIYPSAGGGGKVLQVVNVTKTDRFTTTTALPSFSDVTGMSVAITPSATTSKVLVLISCQIGNTSGSTTGAKILRDSTAIHIGDSSGSATRMTYGSATLTSDEPDYFGASILDSPNTTSEITYKLQVSTRSGGTAVVGGGFNTAETYNVNAASSITLMEIGA